jgi:hypothetical protein
MIARLLPELMFIGELERSGNPRRESSLRDPRSEFHTSKFFKEVMKFNTNYTQLN